MNSIVAYTNATLINYSLHSSAESSTLPAVQLQQEGEGSVDTVIQEMQRRATNIGYGFGVALGRAIGTRPDDAPDSPSLISSIWNKIQCSFAFTIRSAPMLSTLVQQNKCSHTVTRKELGKMEWRRLSSQDVVDAKEPTFLQLLAKMHYHREQSSIDQELGAQFRYLAEKIDAESKIARSANKPVLILIGERHFSLHSLLQELLILRVASQTLSVGAAFTEQTHSSEYSEWRRSGIWGLYTIERALSHLGIKKIPIDIPLSYKGGRLEFFLKLFLDELRCPFCSFDEWGRTVERNNHMAKVILESEMQDHIGIVGAFHLWGLVKESSLTEKYHVIPINTVPDGDLTYVASSVEITYLNSSEVIQATNSLFTKAAPTFLTPNIMLKLILTNN